MKIGMMPAKLTHIMINIGLAHTDMDTTSNIYDPFCGLGTTILMANALGYHAIGSDIQPEQAQKNIDRRKSRKSTEHRQQENIYIFQHDVTKPFNEPKLQNVSLIVSE
jgi:tRNA G10  N-methylase Trm11